MMWDTYVDKLAPEVHLRLMLALGTGLREARIATEVATHNGHVRDAVQHLEAAITWLEDARKLIVPPKVP